MTEVVMLAEDWKYLSLREREMSEETKTDFTTAERATIYKLIRAVRPELLEDGRYSATVREGYVEDVGRILREHYDGSSS